MTPAATACASFLLSERRDSEGKLLRIITIEVPAPADAQPAIGPKPGAPGPGGYAAAFYAADLGMQVTLVDPEANPGGVCLYRGCIPSKALLHIARVLSDVEESAAYGISFGEPEIDQ